MGTLSHPKSDRYQRYSEDFIAYHRLNPHVYDMVKDLAYKAYWSGQKRTSMKRIFEVTSASRNNRPVQVPLGLKPLSEIETLAAGLHQRRGLRPGGRLHRLPVQPAGRASVHHDGHAQERAGHRRRRHRRGCFASTGRRAVRAIHTNLGTAGLPFADERIAARALDNLPGNDERAASPLQAPHRAVLRGH